MRVRIISANTERLKKPSANFVGLLAEFFPMYQSEWGTNCSGTVFMLEGPLIGQGGFYFDEIKVSPMTLDNVLGEYAK